jgi:hypothetical protein
MGAAGGGLRTAHFRQDRPKGRKIGRTAAPARRANGKQAHAKTPPPIKEEERDPAGSPITRRTPNRQDKPAARGAFSATIDRPAVSLKGYMYQAIPAPGRADMEIRAPRRTGQAPKTLHPTTDSRGNLARLSVFKCILEQGGMQEARALIRGPGPRGETPHPKTLSRGQSGSG